MHMATVMGAVAVLNHHGGTVIVPFVVLHQHDNCHWCRRCI